MSNEQFNKILDHKRGAGELENQTTQILYLSSFPPRECGIATFTRDLTSAVDRKSNPNLKSKILAINDNGSSLYNYNRKVKFQINETDLEDYINVAKKINQDGSIKLINIEHEFGLFGGIFGDYLIAFLETVKKPTIVTFHSIIPNPPERLKRVVKSIFKRCAAVVVIAETAIKIFKEDYGLDVSKIKVIHHGVPTIKFGGTDYMKKMLGLDGRKVLSTFGLINRGKGIESVIKALPKIINKYPNILYLVIGETHPQVRKWEGEHYRNRLIKLTKSLMLTENVKFYNKYLALREIIDYLVATDIYVSPALDANQISSGTLSYALSAGKAIISTPSLYAKEILADERGILVNFKNPAGIAEAIKFLFDNPDAKTKIEEKAFKFSRIMTWPNVADEYLKVYQNIIEIQKEDKAFKFPKIKINHLLNLTDDVGIIQHAKHSINDRGSGYTVDDNARALIVSTMHWQKFGDEASKKLINTYLSFLYHAQKQDGRFHNFMDYNRKFLDKVGSEDCFGQTLWASGYVVSSNLYQNTKITAKYIFDRAVKNVFKIKSPKAIAFGLLGLYYYAQEYPNKDILEKIKKLADRLVALYAKQRTEEWHWFEEEMTYSNGRLPEALFLAYKTTGDKIYLKVALESLGFLANLVIIDGKLVLIGHNGWCNIKGKRAYFDQQPVDASSMVQAFLTAYDVTGKEEYYDKAVLSFHWFLGRNSINQPLYDEVTGGCFDGLLPNCVNLNQGAESTICYLLARMSFDN